MTNSLATERGTLYIVATPIGNREDITLRALALLKTVDLILAEDTRHSLQLLTALGIKNNISSLHAHNEAEKSQHIIQQLLEGKSVALISDAGTPLISDPGYPLVKLARQNEIKVAPIPGPCALIAALSAAGLPCDSFTFLGFLPAKHNARKDLLLSIKNDPHTVVFYESTHRILDCIEDLSAVFAEDVELTLAKELTKTFEQFITGTAAFIKEWLLAESGRTKGEFVLIIPPRHLKADDRAHEQLLKVLLAELPLKQAVAIACKLTDANKNDLYELALTIKGAS